MPRLLTAKLTIAICVLASLLAGCGGSNTEDAAPTPVPEAQEEQSLVLVPCLETLSRASEQIRGIPFNWQGSRAHTEPDPGDLLFPPGFFIA